MNNPMNNSINLYSALLVKQAIKTALNSITLLCATNPTNFTIIFVIRGTLTVSVPYFITFIFQRKNNHYYSRQESQNNKLLLVLLTYNTQKSKITGLSII